MTKWTVNTFTEISNTLKSLGPLLDFLSMLELYDTKEDLGKVSRVGKNFWRLFMITEDKRVYKKKGRMCIAEKRKN